MGTSPPSLTASKKMRAARERLVHLDRIARPRRGDDKRERRHHPIGRPQRRIDKVPVEATNRM